jgi:UDP-glucose 4-epimerase
VALLGEIPRLGYRKVVFASSALVYGPGDPNPRGEGDPIAPPNAYARLKREGELAALQDSHNVVVRLANVYGPGMSSANVLSDILKQKTSDVEVRDGAPVRDYLHAEDAARGIVALALSDEGGIFNLGSGKGTSVETLGRLVMELTQRSGGQVRSREPGPGPRPLVLSSEKIRQRLGWTPKVDLRSGIAQLLNRGNQ